MASQLLCQLSCAMRPPYSSTIPHYQRCCYYYYYKEGEGVLENQRGAWGRMSLRGLEPWPLKGGRRSRSVTRVDAQDGNRSDISTPPPNFDPLQNWPRIGLSLVAFGFLLGPPLDGIHSRVGLQVYENGAIDILGLHTNIVVPPLLAVFYGVVGLLQLCLDKWLSPKNQLPRTSLRKVISSAVFLAVILEASAEMYKAEVPYNIESYILFAMAELNWLLFDGTWWGFALASLIGVVCPLAEIPIIKLYDVWHYPNANVVIFGEGLVTWVLICYFSYLPFLANLSRWLSSRFGSEQPKNLKG